jgi:DNA-binding MarR family transcriptional regulator
MSAILQDGWRATHTGRLLGEASRRFDTRVQTLMAQAAGMSKQAMTTLVDECEAWGLVQRETDTRDSRAKIVRFTPTGLEWLSAFEAAVAQAQYELEQDVGEQIARVMTLGLEAYARGYENH